MFTASHGPEDRRCTGERVWRGEAAWLTPLAQLLGRAYSAAEREVIYRPICVGGQVRHFAADPIPRETLQRILDVALDAPFVGRMHICAERGKR
jgi:hypothetical protein